MEIIETTIGADFLQSCKEEGTREFLNTPHPYPHVGPQVPHTRAYLSLSYPQLQLRRVAPIVHCCYTSDSYILQNGQPIHIGSHLIIVFCRMSEYIYIYIYYFLAASKIRSWNTWFSLSVFSSC